MDKARPASLLLGDKRAFVFSAIGIAAALALMLAARPWTLRAANSIAAAISAVGFAADVAGSVSSFPDTDTASTGFISIPSARALLNAPRWRTSAGLTALAPHPADRHMALAVVGMPIDTDNALISGRVIEQACLEDDGNVASCSTQDKLYQRPKYGKHLNLCDFDEECWHSTAAALVAIGSGSANPFATPGQEASAEFVSTTFSSIAEQDWKDYRDSPEKPTFKQFLSERFPDFGPILKQKVEVATVRNPFYATRSAYITRPILVDRGLSPVTPLIAINVFRGYGGKVCRDHQRGETCLLTSTAAQEAALRYLLERVDHGTSSSLLPAAVVLIAAGELVSAPCADTPMARLISDLRRRGVVTFVAVGNDAKANQVRFPACAPDAIAVGSLLRDGTVANFGNGHNSGLVSLYADGEVVALPLRGPRIKPVAFAGSINPEFCRKDGGYGEYCTLRDPADEYNAFLGGGTLLSTAAVSGIFLDLHRHYDDLPADAIVNALKAAPAVAGAAAPEADETRAAHWLDDYRQHHVVSAPQPIVASAKSGWKVSLTISAIVLFVGLAFAWRLYRRKA